MRDSWPVEAHERAGAATPVAGDCKRVNDACGRCRHVCGLLLQGTRMRAATGAVHALLLWHSHWVVGGYVCSGATRVSDVDAEGPSVGREALLPWWLSCVRHSHERLSLFELPVAGECQASSATGGRLTGLRPGQTLLCVLWNAWQLRATETNAPPPSITPNPSRHRPPQPR